MTEPPAFSTEPAVILAALVLTTLGLLVVGFFAYCLKLIVWPIDQRCRSRRAGCQCVHWEGHPGSHRDEFGGYWNDPIDR